MSKITIDSYQLFPKCNTNNINNKICLYSDPKTAIFLKENKHLIDSYSLSLNTSDWIIDFILDEEIRELIDFDYFSDINNDKLVKYLIELSENNKYNLGYKFMFNENDIAVEYLINNPDKIDYEAFSENKNDKAVEYLINNPDKIDYEAFSENNNNKAVNYLLNNPDKIDYNLFSMNNNEKAVDYLLNNLDKIDFQLFNRNNNNKAVKYLIKHPDKIDWFNFNLNKNYKAVEYLINKPDKIIYNAFTSNSNDNAIIYLLKKTKKLNKNDLKNWFIKLISSKNKILNELKDRLILESFK